MRKERKKRNQQGMTLIELVVVILIMGILSAASVAGIGYVNSMNATSAAEKVASLLNRTRVLSISAEGSVTLVLSQNGNSYYGKIMRGGTEEESVKLGTTNLDIKVLEGATLKPLDSVTCSISFKKENGAFDSCPYSAIVVEGTKTKTVRLVQNTGRCYVE